MQKTRLIIFAIMALLIGHAAIISQEAKAHCQVPCGIYDDHARVDAMLEDAVTIQKSITLITELSGKTDAQSQNQLVRWVTNKEVHAQKVISTIADYFLTQRVKPSQKDYLERLQKHHAVILAAMKAKQSSNVNAAKAMIKAIESIAPYYIPK